MEYIRTKKYDTPELRAKIMGPHPLKIEEELLQSCKIPAGAIVMDLGSGQGLTSVFLAKEYGFKVYAADLWSDPAENQKFFDEQGVSREMLIPVKADATKLPFEKDFFDGVICTDSYNYFGRDKEYLDKCLLPCVKPGGYVYVALTGMVKDCHDALPAELLLSWTPEQMDYMHDIDYWRGMVSASRGFELVSINVMESMDEVWNDWLECENEYSINDRKSMNAGAGKYLNFIAFVLRKK